ncbi:MAG: cefD [Rhodospirillales bacterium]|nr:cefD [Rhodospirillales bacterium]
MSSTDSTISVKPRGEGNAPPPYGRAVRGEFLLDPDFLIVNHGSFGAAPRSVLAAQDEWRRQLETSPTRFMNRVLTDALRHAAGRLAASMGASGDDLVFVDNATTGCNAVLRSLDLGPGDEILVTDHTYPAIRRTADYVAYRTGARVVVAEIPYPPRDAAAIVAAVAGALTPRTSLAILDHVTSPTALVMPLEALIAACRAVAATVLVDGAHAPGNIPLDLPALGTDWYVGNCHKWLMAPKGAGFLWASKPAQAAVHPATISLHYGEGFTPEFDWTGTRDPSACLAVTAALDFQDRLGGPALMQRNATLAQQAATLVAGRLGTESGTEPSLAAAMTTVRLPLAGPATQERALALAGRLLDDYRCDAPITAFAGALWLRLSAAAYNDIDDYAEVATRVAALLRSPA